MHVYAERELERERKTDRGGICVWAHLCVVVQSFLKFAPKHSSQGAVSADKGIVLSKTFSSVFSFSFVCIQVVPNEKSPFALSIRYCLLTSLHRED